MSNLQSFKINNLFGYQNVDLKFDEEVLILIGENGLGKTSILNSIFFTLTRKWQRLSTINFESIEFKLNNRDFSFTKEELLNFNDIKNLDLGSSENRVTIYNLLKSKNFKTPEELIEFYKKFKTEISDYFSNHDEVNVSPETTRKYSEILNFNSKLKNLLQIDEYIDNLSDFNLMYFPTYRRVEEELQYIRNDANKESDYWSKSRKILNLELTNEKKKSKKETLIQFGMNDVKSRIDNIIDKIHINSRSGFTKVTGEILHQLQEGFPRINKREINSLNSNNVEIILNRVKNNLSAEDRDNILELLKTNQLVDKKELAYFLMKLEEVYQGQRELDSAIKKFSMVCNQYLVGKKFVFDESLVELDIYNEITKDKVELNQLSSGEKQIVSIFSKLYLEDLDEQHWIFFDEPELSLSIKWQRLLLPHIMESEKCKFLLAVTHSPFIFDNDLGGYAIGMNTFID